MKVQSFFGSDPSNGSGSQSLGLDVEVQDWTSLLIAIMSLIVSTYSGLIAAGVPLGVPSFMGLTCTDLGCAEGCVDWCADMGAGVGRWDGV